MEKAVCQLHKIVVRGLLSGIWMDRQPVFYIQVCFLHSIIYLVSLQRYPFLLYFASYKL